VVVVVVPQVQKKRRKYQDFSLETKHHWQLNKIIVIPLLLSAVGVISNMPNHNLTSISEKPRLLFEVQKVVYQTSENLSMIEVHVSDEEAGNPYPCQFKVFPSLFTHFGIH